MSDVAEEQPTDSLGEQEPCVSHKGNARGRAFRRDLIFCSLGLALGCVIGARWLSQIEAAQLLLGTLLPPVLNNWTFDGDIDRLRLGMDKSDVVGVLRLRKVGILVGEDLEGWRQWKSVYGSETSVRIEEIEGEDRGVGLSKAVEVWFAPGCATGMTNVAYLTFDLEGRLCWFGVQEFVLGFSTRWKGIEVLLEEVTWDIDARCL